MKIDGLTRAQIQMCDRLWNMNTVEELEHYIVGLDLEDSQMAKTLIDLMIHESVEEQLASMDRYPDAEKLLKNISLSK